MTLIYLAVVFVIMLTLFDLFLVGLVVYIQIDIAITTHRMKKEREVRQSRGRISDEMGFR